MEETLINMLLNERIVKVKKVDEEPFTLKSGRKSRLFFDIKKASLNPVILRNIVTTIFGAGLLVTKFDKFGSVAVGGVPIASVLSHESHIPQIIIRSEKHETGTKSKIIGDCKGFDILLIEDVATSGGSLVDAVHDIRKAGGTCNKCIVVIDRQEGAEELCEKNGIELYPILTKSDFGVIE